MAADINCMIEHCHKPPNYYPSWEEASLALLYLRETIIVSLWRMNFMMWVASDRKKRNKF
ncbi:hypothetical protein SAMN06265348_106191 [Pedobacter westerhofensis]|uniref:Uncharacterized protein n=1 Tax=Pedobacter westerhofensis TaxID=425512 RepID=A0A521DUG3_9SPHI|nr:hypothetical protein SAMN06265348_106191 [Pedobacter westerhofensis]